MPFPINFNPRYMYKFFERFTRKPLPLRPGSYHVLINYELPSRYKSFRDYTEISKITQTFTLREGGGAYSRLKNDKTGSYWQRFALFDFL
jgi:hypothetical protein